jgi:hypothetical protein
LTDHPVPPLVGQGEHFLNKAQDVGLKDLVKECTLYRYDLQAMKVPSTDLIPKKRRDKILIEKIMKNIEPSSPLKPSEKAVTMNMPKRKPFVPKPKDI